jgi:hypothetical protein
MNEVATVAGLQHELSWMTCQRDNLGENLRVAIQNNNLLEDLLRRWLKREPMHESINKDGCQCKLCVEVRSLMAETEAVLTVPVTEGQ